jgi:hypothetical protein
VLRAKVLPFAHAGSGAQAADVDRLLEGHRQTGERRVLAARPPSVGRLRIAARALEVGLDDGVQLGIVARDAALMELEQLDGGHPARAKRRQHGDG